MSADAPELTVLVAARADEPALARTLDSLAAQTVDAARVDVVVTRTDADGPTAAWAAGMRAARGRFVLCMTAGDVLSARCLAGALSHADERTVVAVPIVDTNVAGRDLGPSSRIARTLAARDRIDVCGAPDRTAGVDATAAVLGTAAGKVLPTASVLDLLPQAPFDEAAETVFLARVAERGGLELTVCDAEDDAFYYRADAGGSDLHRDLEAIVGLNATDGAPAIVHGAVAARFDSINQALRDGRVGHAEVVERAGVLGGRGLDWTRVNRGVARDLAIVYAALPFVDTSANIAARRVRAAGLPVDVICADLTGRVGLDPSAVPLWQEYVDHVYRLPGPITVHGEWTPTTSFCRLGLAVIAAAENDKGPYRSVYSRTMFPASHLLAALHKLRRPDVVWRAEFSDPQQRDSRGSRRSSAGAPDPQLAGELSAGLAAAGFTPPLDASVWTYAELCAYALADEVMFTNDRQRDYMLGYCADPAYAERAAARSVVTRHPIPPRELYSAGTVVGEFDPQCVHVGYFGSFYRTRSITELVDAIGGLDAATRARVRLHVVTQDPSTLRAEAQATGLDDVLVVGGYLGFADYLTTAKRCDVLVVNDYRTTGMHELNPYLPAKYADYLGSGRPIWGIVESGSVLSAEPLAYRSVVGDVGAARAVLRALVDARVTTRAG